MQNLEALGGLVFKRLSIPIHVAQTTFNAQKVFPVWGQLLKTSLDTAWQRFITLAIADGEIDSEKRFALHDLKRRGVTNTTGTRADKQEASGHRDAKMMDVYDLNVPTVSPSAD